MRKILIPLVFLLMILGLGSTRGAASDSYLTHLPLITRAGNNWLGPDGGRPVCLAVDPFNPSIVYACSWGTGMYKSLDSGATWSQINTGLGNSNINSLAVDPVQPGVIYAGTYRDQIYKSIDGGQNWFWSGTGIQAEAIVYTIAIDPTNTNIIYIGTRGISNNGLPPWAGVIYKSSNGGTSWIAVKENIGGEDAQDWVYSLAVNPQAPNNVYAATHEHGVYRSTDYGVNWFYSSEGLLTDDDKTGRSIVVDWELASPYRILFGTWRGNAVYLSLDNGGSWESANDGIAGIPVYGMTMSPQTAATIYLSTFSNGILRSTDRGETWAPRGLLADDIYTVAVNPQDGAILYAGTAGDGLYRSLDAGASWHHSQAGFRNADVISLLAPSTSDHLFTALLGGGVLESQDRGLHWTEINAGLTDKFVTQLVVDPAHPNLLFALTQSGGLFRNDTLSGTGWVFVGEDLPLSTHALPVFSPDDPLASRETMLSDTLVASSNTGLPEAENLLSMVFAPSTPSTVYLGTGGSGIYKSLNGGRDWFPSGLETLIIRSVAVDPRNANIVYASTNGSGYIRASYDGGGSWQALTMYAPVVYSLAVASDGSGVLYLGTSQGLLRYTPATGWTTTGLSGMAVPLVTTSLLHPGVIFAGTGDGAYYSLDGGNTWQYGPAELDGLTVQSITCDPLEPYLFYFGTKTNGLLQAYLDLNGK